MQPRTLRWFLLGLFALFLIILASQFILSGSRLHVYALLAMPLLVVALLWVYQRRMGVLGHSELPDYLSSRALNQVAHELHVCLTTVRAGRELWNWDAAEEDRLHQFASTLAPYLLRSTKTGNWEVTGGRYPKLFAVRMKEVAHELKATNDRLLPRLQDGLRGLQQSNRETLRTLHSRGLIPNPGGAPGSTEDALDSLEEALGRLAALRLELELATREAVQNLVESRVPLRGAQPTNLDELQALVAQRRHQEAVQRLLSAVPSPTRAAPSTERRSRGGL